MSDFLASVERRAFKQAVFATQEEESALDIVQDAMLRLAEKYADKPAAELPLLFTRILQNAIRDHFRRGKVRSTWTTLLSNLGFREDGEETDFAIEIARSESSSGTYGANALRSRSVMKSLLGPSNSSMISRARVNALLVSRGATAEMISEVVYPPPRRRTSSIKPSHMS